MDLHPADDHHGVHPIMTDTFFVIRRDGKWLRAFQSEDEADKQCRKENRWRYLFLRSNAKVVEVKPGPPLVVAKSWNRGATTFVVTDDNRLMYLEPLPPLESK